MLTMNGFVKFKADLNLLKKIILCFFFNLHVLIGAVFEMHTDAMFTILFNCQLFSLPTLISKRVVLVTTDFTQVYVSTIILFFQAKRFHQTIGSTQL